MRAIWLENGRLHPRTDYPRPAAGADEALVRVSLAGICSTDLELLRGYVPGFRGVPGHEFVGVVEAAAEAAWVGRRVVGSINVGCGDCAECRGHGPAHCARRQALGIHRRDGAFADYLTLPLANLHAVPDGVPDEAAVFAEPLAAALRIREQVRIRPSAQAAVLGPGRLGLLAAQVLALGGTRVRVLGRTPAALRLPAAWGLETGLAANEADAAYDLVVEATGSAAGLADALRLARPRGTLVLKSTYAGPATVDLTRLVVAELTVVGSRCGPFAPALRLLAAGQVRTAEMMTAEYPLPDAAAAFAHAARPGALKVLLRP